MGSSTDNRKSNLASDHIAGIVRARDMDRYLAILLSPREKQPALLALAAFHCELGHISHAVSEASLAAIRFQWWRDALQSVQTGEESRTGNPVADALVDTVRLHDLPRELVDEMLDGHEGIAIGAPGESSDIGTSLEAALFELSSLVLGGERGQRLRQASVAAANASAAAKSQGGDRVGRADIAMSQRQECAALLGGLPAVIFPAFLPLSLVEINLDGIVENPVRNLRRVWTIWRAHRKKTLD